jgi:isopentenyldiphosphate isomerase
VAYADRIAECNNADLAAYERWRVAGHDLGGFVRRDRVAALLRPGTPFRRMAAGIELAGDDFASRSSAVARFVARLQDEGGVSLRDEPYPVVAAFGDAPLLQIDRGAVPWFGVRPFGVHLCAFVRRAGELLAWVAVRARDKTHPGQWDNTVAGGQPLGLSLRDNLAKECLEEAGIPAELAGRAVATSTLTYVREEPAGLKPDTLFCFDLELPNDFEPKPNDGEVERFLRLPAAAIAAAVRDSQRCKPNCNLVWIDFLLRHGALDGELAESERTHLAARLRAPLP